MKQARLHTRREFIKKGLWILAAGYTAPSFLTRTVWALNAPSAEKGVQTLPGVPEDRILVVVQLSGGNDGLNTVVPFRMDEYYQNRSQLAIPQKSVLRLNDEIGFHPALAKLKSLYDKGYVGVIQGVGYPNPNRSHFRSMEIWHTANPETGKVEKYGWIGRYFDSACPSCSKPTIGVNIGISPPLAVRSQKGLGISLNSPETFQWLPPYDAPSVNEEEFFYALNTPVRGEEGPLDFLRHTAMNAILSSQDVRDAVSRYTSSVEYPNTEFSGKMKLIAQMIGGKLGTRVYYISIGGFDTHANQEDVHQSLLTQVSEGLDAFFRDLEAQGNANRVLLMTFSEFGRRLSENASGGTDHGTAAPMFIIGKAISPGIYGNHPRLSPDSLDPIGDMQHQIDFRSVYATILKKWLGADSEKILGSPFPLLPFLL